ncbi:MAG TPA: glucans biosynthesis glucosyltransferase MdoH [Polyangiaceae bacterium]|nr:glucans biosynthesis glucosyltransferase MdoH [Polyangiaceae bacterium]
MAAATLQADPELHARAAICHVQREFESWKTAVFEGFQSPPNPLWLRAFLGSYPKLFLGDVAQARTAAARFGDASEGRLPRRAQFHDQKLEAARLPHWLSGLLPALLLTLAAVSGLASALFTDGLSWLELLWLGCFAFLFGLSAVGLSTAVRGFFPTTRRVATQSLARAEIDRRVRGQVNVETQSRPGAAAAPLPRTALVMPVYHEDAGQVFAALAAMRENLLQIPGHEAFEIFVLSDSRDPLCAAEEERAFRRVAKTAAEQIPFFYRRRARNERQKAGNLAEFFERWGTRYRYVIVLDADSLVQPDTLIELVRRMEAAPRLALLQAPITLYGGNTLFARMLQFSNSLCGPLFTRGLARWSEGQANYYGHNAIVRVAAFLECCALPKLEGEAPLGGHILSHDFVEAALLCRAGWQVRIADDLTGSFEGLPPTLLEYVARDRRWCQGNLQHLQVASSRGLKTMSRIHLGLGAAAYLAGPLWLGFLILTFFCYASGEWLSDTAQAGWFAAASTGVLLLGPRWLGWLEVGLDSKRRRSQGGWLRLSASVLAEQLLSALLAPLMMLHHTRIVLSILLGRAVGWRAQNRTATHPLGRIIAIEAPATLLGAAAFLGLRNWAPGLVSWLAPIWLPWCAAIFVHGGLSSERLGQWSRRLGLFLIPSETEPSELMQRARELCAFTASDDAGRFRDLVLDPVLLAAHVAKLERDALGSPARHSGSGARAESLQRLRERALRAGPAALSVSERERLSADPESMSWLHRTAWQHWPVESWEISRERPQVPEEPGASL